MHINNYSDLSLADRKILHECANHLPYNWIGNPGFYNVVPGPVMVDTRSKLEINYERCKSKHGIATVFYVPWGEFKDNLWIIMPCETWEPLLKIATDYINISKMNKVLDR